MQSSALSCRGVIAERKDRVEADWWRNVKRKSKMEKSRLREGMQIVVESYGRKQMRRKTEMRCKHILGREYRRLMENWMKMEWNVHIEKNRNPNLMNGHCRALRMGPGTEFLAGAEVELWPGSKDRVPSRVQLRSPWKLICQVSYPQGNPGGLFGQSCRFDFWGRAFLCFDVKLAWHQSGLIIMLLDSYSYRWFLYSCARGLFDCVIHFSSFIPVSHLLRFVPISTFLITCVLFLYYHLLGMVYVLMRTFLLFLQWVPFSLSASVSLIKFFNVGNVYSQPIQLLFFLCTWWHDSVFAHPLRFNFCS